MSSDAQKAWEAANAPVPDWGWDALPDDEKAAWQQDGPVCLNWTTFWPHAVPNIAAIRTTADRDKVTCEACLWALGSQKHAPPRAETSS